MFGKTKKLQKNANFCGQILLFFCSKNDDFMVFFGIHNFRYDEKYKCF